MSVRSLKTSWKDLLKCGAVFVFITAFVGKIGGLVNLQQQVNNFENHGWLDAGANTAEKATHYMYMIASTLFPPPSEGIVTAFNHHAWWQSPIENGIYFWVGVAMFALTIFGFISNYKDKFARIAAASILVSLYFVFHQALSINENAVVLSTLLYAWAFISLIIMGICRLTENAKIKTAVLSAIAAVCLVWNIIMAVQIFRFGLEHW
jgi:hypothetical protein